MTANVMLHAQDKGKERVWQRLLRERQASGKSVAIFCGERGLGAHQFSWRQRRRRDAHASLESSDASSFTRVRVPLAWPTIEVVHPTGCIIRVLSASL